MDHEPEGRRDPSGDRDDQRLVWRARPRDTPYLEGIGQCTGVEEAPIDDQDVPLNFGARADAVSWEWVASWDSWSPGVVLPWGESAQMCAVRTLVSLHHGWWALHLREQNPWSLHGDQGSFLVEKESAPSSVWVSVVAEHLS